jgi:peptide/nickel transport system substrate-binding protein
MARRIRWQIVIAVTSTLLILVLLTTLALSNTTVARPLTGGSYIEAVVKKPQQLLPLINNPLADPTGRDIGTLVFDGLTSIGVDGFPKEGLAARWEIGEDGLIYTFHLRRNVSWHDGTPFTADDVLFTLQSIQHNNFTGDPSLAVVWRNVLVERMDDYTIRCTLNAPYAPFLSAARVPILPAHLLADTDITKWADSAFAQNPVGTGPYTLAELNAEHAVLEANRGYFAGSPFIEQIELKFIESRETALALLMRQEAHAMGMIATQETNQVAFPYTYRRVQVPMDEYTILTFNMRESPLDNTDVRRALAHGFDKDALITDVLDSTGIRLDTPILPGWWAYAPTIQWYAYNKGLASQMLEDRGYTLTSAGVREQDGEPLEMTLITDSDPSRLLAAQEIARQWGEIGIRIEIEQVESADLRLRLRSHDFTLAIHGWARLGPDPDVFELWHSSQATDGNNYAGLRDDTIDEALIQGRLERDFVIRSKHYADFQQRWVEQVPGITLYQPLYTFVVSEETGGMGFDTSGTARSLLLIGREDRYRNISRWFVQSSREIRGTLR